MSRGLQDNDHAYATTPAESLDLACIADLGTWAKMAAFFPNPRTLGENEKILTS